MTQPADLTRGPGLPDAIYTSGLIRQNGLTIREMRGRDGTDESGSATANVTWLVQGSNDPTVCRAALLAVGIQTYDGMQLKSLSRERLDGVDDAWEFTAHYDLTTPEVGGYTVNIDTSGSLVLQTSAISQTSFGAFKVGNAGATHTPVDYGTSIDVQDGRAQGVQRIIPALRINVRAKIASAYITSPMAYAKLVARLTGTVNNAASFGGEFAAGELLFAGATGEVIAQDPQLTFSFLASENVTGLTIGQIAGITKKGHDYLWYSFREDKDATTGMKIIKPRAAYVGEIYSPADHAQMKIGVP